MKKRFFQQISIHVFVSLFLVVFAVHTIPAKATVSPLFDVVVKIGNIEDSLNLIDEMSGTGADSGTPSPSMMLRGMLQDLSWIDSTRSIAIGIRIEENQPIPIALIPFKLENNAFQATYNAKAGSDYYIVTLPPGQEELLSTDLESALDSASKSKSDALLSVEFAVNRLLQKNEERIEQLFEKMPDISDNQTANPISLTPEDIQTMMQNMLDTLRQLESFSMGIELSDQTLSGVVEAHPVKESKLSQLFKINGKTALLSSFESNLPINFRTRSFKVKEIYELVNGTFGKFYEKIGIDFAGLREISTRFTGEMAGGVKLNKDAYQFEMIGVLKDVEIADDFLETVYVPWLKKYSEDLTKIMEKQLGSAPKNVFEQTPDSTVNGYNVRGVKIRVPYFIPTPENESESVVTDFIANEIRMTTVKNLLIFAANDDRMKQLIQIAGSLKETPAKGPTMSMDVDMNGYLEAIIGMMPVVLSKENALPKLGKATTRIDLVDGHARLVSSMSRQDMKALVDYFKTIANFGKKAPAGPPKIDPPETMEKKQEPKKIVKDTIDVPKQDAAYWFDQGNLVATYGNDDAAIQHFKKALALEPNNSRVLYELGVCYGEIGKIRLAMESIDKALSIHPEKGIYYYGKARVQLMSGDKESAIEDFKKAASLGHQDAEDYLQNSLHIASQ